MSNVEGTQAETSNLEKIQAAEASVATLQEQLDQVQRTLHRAEQLAAAGEAAKEKAGQLTIVAAGVLALGVTMLVASRLRR